MHGRNARTCRNSRWMAAALAAIAGLAITAAPASAQQRTSTTITSDNGETSTVIRTLVGGVEYRVELENGEITEVTADGLEVGYGFEDGVVSIEGEDVTIVVPPTGQIGGIGRIGIGREMRLPELIAPARPQAIEQLNPLELDGNNWRRWAGVEPPRMFDPPKTMVGLTQVELGDQLREHLGLDDGQGTVVLSIVEGLPADKAGLMAGDVLIEIAGEPVEGTQTLTEALAEREPGQVLGLVLLRKGSPVSSEIVLEAYDPQRLNPFIVQPRVGLDGGGRWEVEVFPGRLEHFEGDIEDEFDEFFRDLDGVLDEETLDRVRQGQERARAAIERSRQAVRRAQLEALGQREMLLRDLDGRAIIIEGEANAERERARAESLRFERDELFEHARALSHRLLDAIEDEDASEEIAEDLEQLLGRAMAVHRQYEIRRRAIDRDDHPRHGEAESLRRERDKLNEVVHNLSRDLENRLDRADEPAERLAIAERLIEASNRSSDLHTQYERLRRVTQGGERFAERMPEEGLADEVADRLDDMEDRFDALEDRLDRLLDAIEDDSEQ
ncbi:MAG: PDZ domain-containing protein [Planctomycetota bacterium]